MVWPELVLKTDYPSPMVTVVTGASGYIGSHVVANLLARGEKVGATVRDVVADPERVDHLRNLPIADGGELEVIGMDLFNPDSVDAAIAGCSDLIHTAATVVVRSKDPQRKIVDPSVIGTQNVISAVEKSGTIKRIVHIFDGCNQANGLEGWYCTHH